MPLTHKKPRPGDVFAVPSERGGFYFLVYIAMNRWGFAFGVHCAHELKPDITLTWRPNPLPYVVHTGARCIKNGRWAFVGNRADCLKLFPSNPEIFHSKRDNIDNEMIGEYGSAETSSGALREITKQEAEWIDIDGRYRQVVLEEQLESILNDLIH